MERDYVRLPVPPGAMPEAVARLLAEGFVGANVTMPHKDAAAELADELTPDAARLHAVNTLTVTAAGGTLGANTDAPGFANFLREDASFDADGKTVLLYGGGGAARAVALAVASAGAATLVIALRDPAKGAGFAELVDGPTDVQIIAMADIAPDRDAAPAGKTDLIVNATPLGRGGEDLPLPPLTPGMLVVDLLYAPATTPLQEAAKHVGATAFGGLGLLVHQAALSFQAWTGQKAPLEVMRDAGNAALGL